MKLSKDIKNYVLELINQKDLVALIAFLKGAGITSLHNGGVSIEGRKIAIRYKGKYSYYNI